MPINTQELTRKMVLQGIEKTVEEIIQLEITEKYLIRKKLLEGSKYDSVIGNIQSQLRDKKSFLLFLEEYVKEL